MSTAPDDAQTRLGHEVTRRWRRPGPPLDRGRPAQIGSISQSSQRFVQGLGRPVMVRRALAGPSAAAAASSRDLNVRPPRWWAQASVFAAERDTVPYDFTAPSIARVVRPMPQGTPDRPTGMLASTAPRIVPMTLPAEVRAVGRITDSSDTRSRRAQAPAEKAREPGKSEGTGPAPSDPGRPGGQAPSHVPTAAPAARAGAPAPPATGGTSGWLSRLVRRRAAVAARSVTAVSPSPAASRPPERPSVARNAPARVATAEPVEPATPPVEAAVDTTEAPAATGIAPATAGSAPASDASATTPTSTRSTAAAPVGATGPQPAQASAPSPAGLTLTVQRWWSGVPHRIRRSVASGLAGATALPRAHAAEPAVAPTTGSATGRVLPAAAGLAVVSRSVDPQTTTAASTAAGARGTSVTASPTAPARTSRPAADAGTTTAAPSQVGPGAVPSERAHTDGPGHTVSSSATGTADRGESGPASVSAARVGSAASAVSRATPRPGRVAAFTERRVSRPGEWLPGHADRLTRPVAGPGSDRSLPRATSGTAPGPAPAPLVGATIRRRTGPAVLGAASHVSAGTTAVRPAVARAADAARADVPSVPGASAHGGTTAPAARAGATSTGGREAGAQPGSPTASPRTPASASSTPPAVVARAASSGGGSESTPPAARSTTSTTSPAGDESVGRVGASPHSPMASGSAGVTPFGGSAPTRPIPVRRRVWGGWHRRDARVTGPAIGLALTPETALAGAHRAAARPAATPVLGGHRTAAAPGTAGLPVLGGHRATPGGWHGAAPAGAAGAPALGGHRAVAPAGAAAWYDAPAAAGAASMPVAPPRTVVTPAAEPDASPAPNASRAPESRHGAPAAASQDLAARVGALAAAALTTTAGATAADPRAPGGAVTPPTSALTAPDPTTPGVDEDVISAVVRRVLDAELRDRVNAVVDERLDAERDRRRWRTETGVF